MSRDSLYIEIQDIKGQMLGISPKTETWKKLNVQLLALKAKTGDQDMPIRKQKKVFAHIGGEPKLM